MTTKTDIVDILMHMIIPVQNNRFYIIEDMIIYV